MSLSDNRKQAKTKTYNCVLGVNDLLLFITFLSVYNFFNLDLSYLEVSTTDSIWIPTVSHIRCLSVYALIPYLLKF